MGTSIRRWEFDLALSGSLSISLATVLCIKNILNGGCAVPRLSSAYQVGYGIELGTVSTAADRFSGLMGRIFYGRLNSTNNRAHLRNIVSLSTLSLHTVK